MEGSVQNNYTLLRTHICYMKRCQYQYYHSSYSFFSSGAPLMTAVHAKCTQICNEHTIFQSSLTDYFLTVILH